jgi:hypothetical protein
MRMAIFLGVVVRISCFCFFRCPCLWFVTMGGESDGGG